MAAAIPKKIHQIWLGSEVPAQHQAYSKRLQELHPDWEYRLWRDSDLDWLAHRAEFDLVPLASTKSNIARYEIIERYGGLYLDTDFEPLKPLDPLLDRATMLVCSEAPGYLNCAFFGATPGHPVMRYVLETLGDCVRANIGRSSPEISGPVFFTRAVRRGAEITGGDCLWLPAYYFYPYGHDQPELASLSGLPETYAIHRWASSWVAPPSTKQRRSKARRALRDKMKRLVTKALPTLVRPPQHGAVNIDNGRVLVNVWGEFPLIARSSDLGILPSLMMGYKKDEEYFNFLKKIIRQSDRVIDVGANIGYTVLAAARCLGPSGRIDAFEPASAVAEILRDNVYMNRAAGVISCDVAVHEVAIGRSDGSGRIATPVQHSGRGSMRPGAYDKMRDEGLAVEECAVETRTFGSALPGLNHARLVKIDVEGLEPDVLQSMRPAIAEGRIDYVDIEVFDAHLGAAWPALEEQLKALRREHGAKFYRLKRDGAQAPIALERVLQGPSRTHLVFDFSTSRHRQQG